MSGHSVMQSSATWLKVTVQKFDYSLRQSHFSWVVEQNPHPTLTCGTKSGGTLNAFNSSHLHPPSLPQTAASKYRWFTSLNLHRLNQSSSASRPHLPPQCSEKPFSVPQDHVAVIRPRDDLPIIRGESGPRDLCMQHGGAVRLSDSTRELFLSCWDVQYMCE